MDINWEQFEEQGSLDQAAVVIKTTGKVFLNEQAFARLTAETRTDITMPGEEKEEVVCRPDSVKIFYDDKQKILGFKPFQFAPGATATRFEYHGPKKRPFIPLANFFEAKGMSLTKELHLQLELDPDANIHFIRLPKPGRNTRKPRRKQ